MVSSVWFSQLWYEEQRRVKAVKTMKDEQEYTVLPKRMGGGPHNLGDPDDQSLRKVEKDVLIPQKMREKARKEKCIQEVKEFSECCKDNGYLMVVKCRKQNSVLLECLTSWYQDEGFKEKCKQEYLRERSEYRRTGIAPEKRGGIRVQPA